MSSPSHGFWLRALAATMFMQIVVSFLGQSLWVMAPILTEAAGVTPERIGWVSALVSLGTVGFLMLGGPLIEQVGSIRLLQIGAAATSASLVLFAVPIWPIMLLASLLNGIAYGPTPPSGSDILGRYSPPSLKATIFSIKQAGAPLGGSLAGAVLPALTIAYGWQWAMVIAAAVGLVSIPIIQPLRRRVDAEARERPVPPVASLLNWTSLTLPFRAVRLAPALPLLTAAAVCFAVIQGNLFTFMVTYLATEQRFELGAAGLAYATMQTAGMIGRVLMGWVADRLGSVLRTMKVLSIASAAMALTVATLRPDWPWPLLLAVMAATGIASTSWNGIYLAEVARLAPPGRIGEATSGSVFFTFIGYTLGPIGFATVVGLLGRYALGYALIAGLGLAAFAALLMATRKV